MKKLNMSEFVQKCIQPVEFYLRTEIMNVVEILYCTEMYIYYTDRYNLKYNKSTKYIVEHFCIIHEILYIVIKDGQ